MQEVQSVHVSLEGASAVRMVPIVRMGNIFSHFVESELASGSLFKSQQRALLVMQCLLHRTDTADVLFLLCLLQVIFQKIYYARIRNGILNFFLTS